MGGGGRVNSGFTTLPYKKQPVNVISLGNTTGYLSSRALDFLQQRQQPYWKRKSREARTEIMNAETQQRPFAPTGVKSLVAICICDGMFFLQDSAVQLLFQTVKRLAATSLPRRDAVWPSFLGITTARALIVVNDSYMEGVRATLITLKPSTSARDRACVSVFNNYSQSPNGL